MQRFRNSLVVKILKFGPEYFESWYVFCILMTGSLISSGYIPFQMILNQTGYPGYQTLFMVLLFSTNFILNILLIPVYGIYGAAAATSFSMVSSVIFLKLITSRIIGIKI